MKRKYNLVTGAYRETALNPTTHEPYKDHGKHAIVVIPTYNEAENICPLVAMILTLPGSHDVLVVDDNSPDGTANVVLEKFAEESRVHIVRRKQKLGLGTAYSAGFRFALEEDYSFVVTMDADFSHNPRDIPRLEQEMDSSDLIIGSRYIEGGATAHWGIFRKLISRTANIVANQFLHLCPHDCTSGFRLYRTDALRRLSFETVHADGYSYLLELLFRASKEHMRVQEVPILFVDREKGKSKISRKEIFKAIQTILRLRFGKSL